jgi:hypothetical protein
LNQMWMGVAADEYSNRLESRNGVTGRPQRPAADLSVPVAGKLLGLGREASYRAAATGELLTIKFGRRLFVPMARLLQMLGVMDKTTYDQATGDDPQARVEVRRDHRSRRRSRYGQAAARVALGLGDTEGSRARSDQAAP